MSSTIVMNLYKKERNEEFDEFIKTLLTQLNINKYSNIFEYLCLQRDVFSQILTSKSYSTSRNYEAYEQIGDSLANSHLLIFSMNKYPEMKCREGVVVASRIKIKYGSKEVFWKIGEALGMWEWINAAEHERSRMKKSLLEDCFEALIGGIFDTILNSDLHPHVDVRYSLANVAVKTMLDTVYSELDIKRDYDTLYDPITRLKELVGRYRDEMKEDYSVSHRDEDKNKTIQTVKNGITGEVWAIGVGNIKQDAKRDAAKKALKFLIAKGYTEDKAKIEKFEKFIHPIRREIKSGYTDFRLSKSAKDPIVKTTRFLRACEEHDLDTMKKLCKVKGFDHTRRDSYGRGPLDCVLCSGSNTKIEKWLSKKRYI